MAQALTPDRYDPYDSGRNHPVRAQGRSPRQRWPVRRSVMFVLAASMALWLLILTPALAL
ncbi:hypothetical protein [Phenylobacterium sp.]|uniref:hypothetical protein n=1 Tax=Phenylobacterium sp. TaxID=1871053 RepID=UPI00272F0D64|nr:hypothetical protein [Phenylobacterium sp.]MDP2215092.1 hypothetical protein [Phenylobacterium sp.]